MIRETGSHAGLFSVALGDTTSRATLAQKHHLEEEVGKIKGGEGRSRRRDSFTLLHATRSDGQSAEPRQLPVEGTNLDSLAIASITGRIPNSAETI